MNKRVPYNILLFLSNWYKLSNAIVNWNGVMSNKYVLCSGIRQGGVLSPVLFALYIDNVIVSLKKQGFGCHIGLQCLSVLMYADDLILVSGSVTGLQSMLNMCIAELDKLDLKINTTKSVCIRIGSNYKCDCCNLSVNNSEITWPDQLIYLGITIKAASKFLVD